MGKRMLIAFIPEKEVVDNLVKIRKIANIKTKRKSAPHITIIDNSYSSVKEVDKKLKEISKTTKPITTKIKGIDKFVINKKLKIKRYQKNNSLIYLIDNNSSMKRFRRRIANELYFLRTKERVNQWKKENPKILKKILESIEKYGTPFKKWRFHVTMGLISKKNQYEILDKIKKLNIQKTWKINNFGLFIRRNGWKLIKKYYLKK